nr:hypothetical protein [Belnapia moabensis]
MARRLALAEAMVVVSGRPRPQDRQMPDQRHPAGDCLELLAQSRRRADHDGLQRQHGLGARLDGGVTGDLEVSDHLHLTGAGLGQSRGLPTQHGAGGAFGIEAVRFAMPVAQPAIGPAGLVNGMARRTKKARQASAVRARALDAEGADGSQ